MPISKSAKKALHVSRRKASLNRHRKALIKEALKNVTKESAAQAVSMIDKGAKWGLFHKNKAARMKSALTKKIGETFPAKAAKSVRATKPKAAAKKAATKTATKPRSAKPKAKK